MGFTKGQRVANVKVGISHALFSQFDHSEFIVLFRIQSKENTGSSQLQENFNEIENKHFI